MQKKYRVPSLDHYNASKVRRYIWTEHTKIAEEYLIDLIRDQATRGYVLESQWRKFCLAKVHAELVQPRSLHAYACHFTPKPDHYEISNVLRGHYSECQEITVVDTVNGTVIMKTIITRVINGVYEFTTRTVTVSLELNQIVGRNNFIRK